MTPTITVIIPAHNEGREIAETIESVLAQTTQATRVIVVDDCSTDNTGDIARGYALRGVEVLRPPKNLGSKAKAQNYAMKVGRIETDLVLPLDGDTLIAADYIELMLPVFDDPEVSVASGCVLTKRQETIWEKARHLEYLQSFHFHRSIQQMARSITVCSGCCTVFRREFLEEGFPEVTLTEDIYYTWTQHIAGRKAVYVAAAVAWAAEPTELKYLNSQLKRWKCGWFDGFRRQYLSLLRKRPMVAMWAGLQFLETVLAPLIIALPFLAFFFGRASAGQVLTWWALGDLITFWPPVLYGCWRRGYSVWRVVTYYPLWYLLKAINFRWDMQMIVRELLLVPLGIVRPFTVYERGKA